MPNVMGAENQECLGTTAISKVQNWNFRNLEQNQINLALHSDMSLFQAENTVPGGRIALPMNKWKKI